MNEKEQKQNKLKQILKFVKDNWGILMNIGNQAQEYINKSEDVELIILHKVAIFNYKNYCNMKTYEDKYKYVANRYIEVLTAMGYFGN